MIHRKKHCLTPTFVVFILLGVALVNQTTVAQQGAPLAQSVPNLHVQGRAELSKPADEFRVNIGVTTQHEEAAEAMRTNSRRMNEIIAAIERAGLDEDDYSTGRFQIHPVYSQRPQRPGEEWQPRIVGYRVTNIAHVKTQKIDLAGAVIDEAGQAGANQIDSIQFTLSDPRAHRAEAIHAATQAAISDAHTLARSARLRLVRIVSVSLDEPPPVIPVRQEMMMRVAMDAAEESTPIRPGDVTVRATVNVVYEIAPQE